MITAGGIIETVRQRLQGRTATGTVDLTSLIAGVRGTLNDNVEPYRWNDAVLLAFLNEGVMEVRKLRHDACLNDDGSTGIFVPYTTLEPDGGGVSSPDFEQSPSPEDSSGGEIQPAAAWALNADYQAALEHYMLYRAFERDSDDQQANTALAGQQYKLFAEQIAIIPRFYTGKQLCGYLARGIGAVTGLRPDLLINEHQKRRVMPPEVDEATEIELPDMISDALVFYVLYRALDGIGQDKAAQVYFAQYQQEMQN